MFESARLKIDRAKHHVLQLEIALDKYADTAVLQMEADSGVTVTTNQKIEPNCALIIGDAIHNIRSALDHAFWELIGIDSGAQDNSTTFPIHANGTRQNYVGSCNGIVAARRDTKDLLIAIGAYENGPGNVLCQLHRFDIIDKHALLTPVWGVTSFRDCKMIRADGTVQDWSRVGAFLRDDGQPTTIYPFGGMRFQFDKEPKAAFDIFFQETDFISGEAVIPALDKFSSEVLGVIRGMERMTARRT